jgi:hypothetical protein
LAAAAVVVVVVLETAARNATAVAVAAAVLMYPRFYLPQTYLVGMLLLAPQDRQEVARQALLLPEAAAVLAVQVVSQVLLAVQEQYTRRLTAAVAVEAETKPVLPAAQVLAAAEQEPQVLHRPTLRILPDPAAALQVVRLTLALPEEPALEVGLQTVALVLPVMPAVQPNMAVLAAAVLLVVTRLPGQVVALSTELAVAAQVVVQTVVTRLVMQELAA